jgi:RNA polymerase sigma-70 factor (ECF subfamily)
MDNEKTRSELSSEPDEVLVERARKDPEAFGELYERYIDRIYRYLYYRTGNTAEAEDLAEKVFLQALSHLPTYRHRGHPFGAWLFAIAHNLVANWHRARARHRVLPLEDARSLAVDPDDQVERAEETARVRAYVAELPWDRQYLLFLKFAEERSNGEIAALLGRSEGAVKALLHRTLRQMRRNMEMRRDGPAHKSGPKPEEA